MAKDLSESYLADFDKLDAAHLLAVREVRRKVLNDARLDVATGWILGLTGSVDELDHYERLAQDIGENIGQPIIKIESTDKRHGGEGDYVVVTRAGIIAGDLAVRGCHFIGQEVGTGSGHVSFHVPVSPLIACHFHTGMQVFKNEDVDQHHQAIELFSIVNGESTNKTNDPINDFKRVPATLDETGPGAVYIGREEMFFAPWFQPNLAKTLLALEEVVQAGA